MRVLLLAALFGLAARPLSAEVRLQRIDWQVSKKLKGKPLVFEPVKELPLQGSRTSGGVRALLTLQNRGPKPVEGLLLRYSVTARLIPKEGLGEPVWAVPFMLDERRVPKVGPNQSKEVPLDTLMLPMYLVRMSRAGLRPDRLKLQVMVDPRPGGRAPVQTLESELPVAAP